MNIIYRFIILMCVFTLLFGLFKSQFYGIKNFVFWFDFTTLTFLLVIGSLYYFIFKKIYFFKALTKEPHFVKEVALFSIVFAVFISIHIVFPNKNITKMVIDQREFDVLKQNTDKNNLALSDELQKLVVKDKTGVKKENLVKVEDSLLLINNVDSLISNLSGNTTMAEQYNANLFSKILYDEDNGVDSEIASKILEHLTVLTEFAQEGDWGQYLNFLEDINDVPKSAVIEAASTVAISFKAPKEVILELFNNGAELNIFSVASLLKVPNREYLELLANIGMNFTDIESNGISAVELAFLVETHPNNFDFLLSNSSDMSAMNSLGFDVMSSAIINADLNSETASYYISKLIDRGATLNEAHRKLLLELEKTNVYSYNQLILTNPELDGLVGGG